MTATALPRSHSCGRAWRAWRWLALAVLAVTSTPSAAGSTATVSLSVDLAQPSLPLLHSWAATGWCPPDSSANAVDTHAFAMQEASWQNHAFIAAVPNRGIRVVRIHNLLNMITVSSSAGDIEARGGDSSVLHPLPASAYNFSLLDDVLDMVVHDHGLMLGFEIMGNPRVSATSRQGAYTSWAEPAQVIGWRTMMAALAGRYIKRYGIAIVSQ